MSISASSTDQPMLQDFLKLLKERKYSENSLQSHRLDIQKYLDWLDNGNEIKLDQLNILKPVDIEKYVEYLRQDYKASTIARHLSSLKLFLNDLELSGKIRINPVHRVRYPEVIADAPKILSSEEVIKVLEAPDPSHYLGLRDRAILELLYSSGLKVNELLNLNVEDLFLKMSFLKVRGKRERMVPMTSKAVDALEDYLQNSREERLLNKSDSCMFPGRNGTRMSRMGFWTMIRKHAKKSGIENPINGRILRHSFAAHLLENGMDLPDIQDLFGYVSLDSTLQYAHINRPDYFEVYQRHHPMGNYALQKDRKKITSENFIKEFDDNSCPENKNNEA
jgi:integrase/recombinase XerD